MLNLYPYNNGHTLIAPYRHVASLKAFTVEEWMDLLYLANDAIRRLEKVLSPAGYNLGANLGQAAGAGIPGHFHLHVVPRWGGDTNFMPVFADTKIISQSLDSACRLLRKAGSAGPSVAVPAGARPRPRPRAGVGKPSTRRRHLC